MIDFRVAPENYRHWDLQIDGTTARLSMDVDESHGLMGGYELKLNSYDLGVDIELADAITRLRFENPQVKVVILQSAKDNVFCAGANIRMLAAAEHGHKVNFCKFTNETRNMLEASGSSSGQFYLASVQGACAGGGYELALAADHLLLVDDGNASVSLPEVPLLAVLPGTGGLTRLTDKRKIRRDLADVFCTLEEGVKGERALKWRLVDSIASRSEWQSTIDSQVAALSERSGKLGDEQGIDWKPVSREYKDEGNTLEYGTLDVRIDRASGIVSLTIIGPAAEPASFDDLVQSGTDSWAIAWARDLDDALLHLRFNEPEMGVLVFKSRGDSAHVLALEALLQENQSHWLALEIQQLWSRVLKRIDLTSRSLVAQIEPGSCFAGVLSEITFACDRSYMLVGELEDDADLAGLPDATLTLTDNNFGKHLMSNGLSRLQTRFIGDPAQLQTLEAAKQNTLDAEQAEDLGLITYAFDDIDWHDELRIFLEERASFSADVLTAMEANLRFAGPETMETRIFGRLTAWQNWVFQRPSAVSESGALQRYGTGVKAQFDRRRV